MTIVERRKRRSSDPLVALHYQLADAREAAELDAMVVASGEGVVVAGVGAWAVCEEIAAYAPFFARGDGAPGGRLDSLRSEVFVLPVSVDGEEVLLCARGKAYNEQAFHQAAQGVSRILAAPAS